MSELGKPAKPSRLVDRLRSEIYFTFARSSGQGGQNVNKVNSKAILHWNIQTSQAFPEDMLIRLERILGSKIALDGHIQISSDLFRDQPRNKAECLERLERYLQQALRRPKSRIATRPTRGSQERRHQEKKNRQKIKTNRKRVSHHED